MTHIYKKNVNALNDEFSLIITWLSGILKINEPIMSTSRKLSQNKTQQAYCIRLAV